MKPPDWIEVDEPERTGPHTMQSVMRLLQPELVEAMEETRRTIQTLPAVMIGLTEAAQALEKYRATDGEYINPSGRALNR